MAAGFGSGSCSPRQAVTVVPSAVAMRRMIERLVFLCPGNL